MRERLLELLWPNRVLWLIKMWNFVRIGAWIKTSRNFLVQSYERGVRAIILQPVCAFTWLGLTWLHIIIYLILDLGQCNLTHFLVWILRKLPLENDLLLCPQSSQIISKKLNFRRHRFNLVNLWNCIWLQDHVVMLFYCSYDDWQCKFGWHQLFECSLSFVNISDFFTFFISFVDIRIRFLKLLFTERKYLCFNLSLFDGKIFRLEFTNKWLLWPVWGGHL